LFDLWDALGSLVGKHVAQVILLVIVGLVAYILRQTWKLISWMIAYYRRLSRARRDVGRVVTPMGPREGKGLWLADSPTSLPRSYDYPTAVDASRILIVANAKGGVGKTTVCTSLAARFSEILPKPILLIDLDFQASASSMSIANKKDWLPPEGVDSRATYLISGDLKPTDVAGETQHATGATSIKIVTSYYDLAQAENRIMIDWLLSDRKTDIRFTLAELLHSNVVRNAFSVIIIDCPPRLTTAAIQALAAGTHLLIPTRLEEPSTEAVITFVQQVETFRRAGLCPYIKHIGVVATMVDANQNPEGVKLRLKDALKNPLEAPGGGGGDVTQLLDCEIPQSAKFRETSGKGITYLVMGQGSGTERVRTPIQALAERVKKEMKL